MKDISRAHGGESAKVLVSAKLESGPSRLTVVSQSVRSSYDAGAAPSDGMLQQQYYTGCRQPLQQQCVATRRL